MRKLLLIASIFHLIVLSVHAQSSILGVDVYSGNGTISWSLVSSDAKAFAYVKATKGECYTDGDFYTNMANGSGAGVVTGPYDFALPEQYDGVGEANYFYNVAGPYIGGCHLPPALDLEDPAGQCVTNTTALSTYYQGNMIALAQWVNAWATQIHSLSGIWPVLYTTRCYAGSLYPYYQSGVINANVKLWIADYSNPAGSPGNYSGCSPWVGWPWLFHQYFAPGTAGNNPATYANPGMDQDIFNGDLTAFNTLTGCGTTTTCSGFTTTPSSSPTIPAGGGSGSFVFSDIGGCSVNYAINPCPWVTFSNGSPAGTIDYTVSANCGSAQSCILDLTYNGNTVTTFTVYQAAASAPSPPSILPNPSTAICPNGQEQLTASETNCSGCTYSWSNGGIGSTITVYPSSSTGYTVTVTNSCGLSTTNGYYVEVSTLPNQPSIAPTSGCSPLSVTASSNGCSNCTYLWSTPSGSISGSQIQATTSGTYYVTVTNSSNCTASSSNSISLTNVAIPNGTINSTEANPLCNNASTTLSVQTCLSCTYSWSNGAVTPSITVSTAGTYYVTVTNSCNQTAGDNYAVTTGSTPSGIAINGTNVICVNGTTVLTASPSCNGCTYNWSTYGSSGSSNSISISPSSNTQVTVTVTNTCGNASSNPFNITVNNVPLQPSSIVGNLSPCVGSQQTYAVNSVSGDTYTWILPNGWSNSSNSNSIITAVGTTGGTISVTANSACGSSNPQTLTVNPVQVNPSPLTSNPTSVCQNGTITLTANSGATTYQWSGNNIVHTNSNITTATPSISGSLAYTVTATLNACTATATVNVIVIPTVIPSVTLAQSPSSICLDGLHAVTITPNPVNGGTPLYNWSSSCSAGSNNSLYTINGLTTACTVSCTITSNAQCASPATATASINLQETTPSQVGLTISTSATNVCIGSNVTFTAIPVNGGNPGYEWYVDGTPSGTGPSFTIYDIQSDAIVYCSMTSSLSCTTGSPAISNTLNIHVVTQATATITITDSPSVNACAGTPITFRANPGNGGSTPLYQWRVNHNNVGNNSPSSSFTSTTLANNSIVSCVMTSNSTCVTTDTANSNQINVTITPIVVPTITISANPNGAICAGTSITFAATPTNQGNAPTYQWKAAGNDVGSNSTVYTSSSLSNNEVVVCDLTSNANCASPDKVTSNSITINVDAVVVPSVHIGVNPVGAVCVGTRISFTAIPIHGGTTPAYRWMVNGNLVSDTSTTYSSASLANGDTVFCELISNANCAVPDTVISGTAVEVDSTITPTLIISDNPVSATCAGTPVTFTATSTGGGAAFYQWKVNSNNLGSNSSTLQTTSMSNGDTVMCFMTSSLLCANPDTVEGNIIILQVKPSPVATITPSGAIAICAGDSVELSVSEDNPLYHWSTGASTPNIWVSNVGGYQVTVTNIENCSAVSPMVTVTVNALPTSAIIVKLADTLFTTSIATTYQWYLNNLAIQGAINQTCIAVQNGPYQLEVTDSNGCSSKSNVINVLGVGINEVSGIFNFTISPNPSHGQFLLRFETLATEDVWIQVFDPIGRIIDTESSLKVLGSYSREINLGGRASGIYILRLKSGGMLINTKLEIN